MKKLLYLAGWSLMLIGCNAPKQTPAPSPPIISPPAYVEPEEVYNNPGSIYMNSDSDGLFADSRARRVGDIVMVKILENNTAKNKANTTATNEKTNEYGVDSFFGRSAIGSTSGKAFLPIGSPALGSTTSNSTTTKGETNREGTISGTIAARVLKVLPGGLLQIEGVRQTRVNNETQYIVITGFIRPMDVDPDNTITSNRISDAKIEYYGEGVLSGKEKPGWFTRFADTVWPF